MISYANEPVTFFGDELGSLIRPDTVEHNE
jgi:hypothetical protein